MWMGVHGAYFLTAGCTTIPNTLSPPVAGSRGAMIVTTDPISAEPVFGAIFAYLLLGEVLSPRGLAGCALILCGMLAAELA